MTSRKTKWIACLFIVAILVREGMLFAFEPRQEAIMEIQHCGTGNCSVLITVVRPRPAELLASQLIVDLRIRNFSAVPLCSWAMCKIRDEERYQAATGFEPTENYWAKSR